MFACFHISGTQSVTKENLNRLHTGCDDGCDRSLMIRLFMLSGPGAVPVFKNSKTVSTSYGVNWIELSILSLWDIMGSGVLLSSKVFCSQKKSFRSSALFLLSE